MRSNRFEMMSSLVTDALAVALYHRRRVFLSTPMRVVVREVREMSVTYSGACTFLHELHNFST
jgi:hypothetical protein